MGFNSAFKGLRQQHYVKSGKYSIINVANTLWLHTKVFGNTQISNSLSGCDFRLVPFPKRKKTACVCVYDCVFPALQLVKTINLIFVKPDTQLMRWMIRWHSTL